MHEAEVAMRLRFEGKLNNMCSMYRELETRFIVVCRELEVTSDKLQTN